MSGGSYFYPNVTTLPSKVSDLGTEKQIKKEPGVPGEFDEVFDRVLGSSEESKDLSQIRTPLKFSAHASQRLKDRKIVLDTKTMSKVNDAVDRAEAKGIEDTLVLTQNAALIVNVKNRTVVTAMDRNSLAGNVFTNIDGAVVI